MEALRQVRITHRGNYRHLLEDVLISYRLAKIQGEDCTTDESATASTSEYGGGSSNSQAGCESQLPEISNANEDSEMNDEQCDEKM